MLSSKPREHAFLHQTIHSRNITHWRVRQMKVFRPLKVKDFFFYERYQWKIITLLKNDPDRKKKH